MTTTSIRKATHSGSWYSSSPAKLDEELTNWLSQVQQSSISSNQSGVSDYPKKSCKAIIAPHAGYSYSGPTAAYAYSCIDTTHIERVFILGPSHHQYLNGCALSKFDRYDTPLGSLELDTSTIKELYETGKFEWMNSGVDEDEHSIEMHLPYIKKIFSHKPDLKIVPILIGSLSLSNEKSFGSILASYLDDPATLFIISSDFCHWGTRFGYTYYLPPPPSKGYSLDKYSSNTISPNQPIHKSIELLDQKGMEITSFNRSSSSSTANEAHEKFSDYLKETKNTICGRHPIGVLLGTISRLLDEYKAEGQGEGEGYALEWVKYEQSSQVIKLKDSSVSYASAWIG